MAHRTIVLRLGAVGFERDCLLYAQAVCVTVYNELVDMGNAHPSLPPPYATGMSLLDWVRLHLKAPDVVERIKTRVKALLPCVQHQPWQSAVVDGVAREFLNTTLARDKRLAEVCAK